MDYKVPFVGYKLQYQNLKSEIDEAIQSLLQRGDLILRRDVEDFEKNIASFVGTKYAVGVNSCSDALIFSLMAAGIEKGDEVITVSHTFFATIEAVHNVGAKPVLVDVKEDFLMDMEKVKEVISSKTKAIIPVHLNGRLCDMEELMEIAQKYNLMVIEDAAQALGATFDRKKAGSFGQSNCFSFYPAKILGAAGDGGVVTTNDEKIAEKIRLLRDHGQKSSPLHQSVEGGSGSGGKTEIACYGFTSRLHNLQAAVLNVKFKYLQGWIKRRREIAKIYNQGLSDISETPKESRLRRDPTGQVKLPPAPNSDPRYFDVYQNYVLKAEKRDELFEFLKEKGVETLIKDPIPNHLHKELGLSYFHLPYTEQLAKEVISLPMYPELSDEQVEYVTKSVKEFYE